MQEPFQSFKYSGLVLENLNFVLIVEVEGKFQCQ